MRLIDASEPKPLAVTGRRAVMLVEQEVKQLAQLKLHTEHNFAPGVYTRTLYIPRGTLLTGRVHKHEHFNVVLAGTIDVLTDKGYRRVNAGEMFRSPAGVKRAGYAHEDTIWTTIHANPTEERDPDKLEQMLTVATYDELEEHIIEGEIIE